jgi:hypothetical protein
MRLCVFWWKYSAYWNVIVTTTCYILQCKILSILFVKVTCISHLEYFINKLALFITIHLLPFWQLSLVFVHSHLSTTCVLVLNKDTQQDLFRILCFVFTSACVLLQVSTFCLSTSNRFVWLWWLIKDIKLFCDIGRHLKCWCAWQQDPLHLLNATIVRQNKTIQLWNTSIWGKMLNNFSPYIRIPVRINALSLIRPHMWYSYPFKKMFEGVKCLSYFKV